MIIKTDWESIWDHVNKINLSPGKTPPTKGHAAIRGLMKYLFAAVARDPSYEAWVIANIAWVVKNHLDIEEMGFTVLEDFEHAPEIYILGEEM